MAYQELNLPDSKLDIRQKNGKLYVFDKLRKKFVVLTPEEWVRQNFLAYLIEHLKYPEGLVALETPFKVHANKMRSDILVFNRNGLPAMLIECKATQIEISQNTFDQVIVYNMNVNAPILVVTNGLKHYCFKKPEKGNEIVFFKNIPDYKELNSFLG